MAERAGLELAEREFFQIVAQAAFCNPFREQRFDLDAKIIGHAVEPFSELHLDELTGVVCARIKKFDESGLGTLRRYGARDRELMQTVFLFELYHHYYQEFDQLILAQVKAGSQSLRVEFAAEALGRMRQRGITSVESER